MKTSLFAGAGVLILGLVFSAHAALIGTITHDYGLGYSAPSLDGENSCDSLHDTYIAVKTPGRFNSDCVQFFDSFDLSSLIHADIDAFELTLEYSHIRSRVNWYLVASSEAAITDGNPQFALNIRLNRVSSETYRIDNTMSVFSDMLGSGSLFLFMTSDGGVRNVTDFRLYNSSLAVFGSTVNDSTPVPTPGTLVLLGLGLLGLCLRRR